jgi:hypothetical protein
VAANLVMSQGIGRLPGGESVLLRRSDRQAAAQFARWGELS